VIPPRPASRPAAAPADVPSAEAVAPGNRPPATTPPPPPAGPRPDQPQPGRGAPETTGAPVLPASDDALAWIHQRIMTIQHERETRWQKIIRLLPGVS
jgi:hypothetical protein